LSFLDPEEAEECFVFDIFSEAPESEKAIKFTDYVVSNYISSDRSGRFWCWMQKNGIDIPW
jgi:hypothetical protein